MRISDWSSDVCSSDLVDGDVSPRPVLDQYNVERYSQFSQELRIAGNVGTIIDFQAGGYYQSSKLNINPSSNVNVAPLGPPLPGFARANNFHPDPNRSEERRDGKEWVSTCRYGGSPDI